MNAEREGKVSVSKDLGMRILRCGRTTESKGAPGSMIGLTT